MSEIERILKEEIDRVNKAEHRDNRPRFSISFIKNILGYSWVCIWPMRLRWR